MMNKVRKHAVWVWLAVIVAGWVLVLASPKMAPNWAQHQYTAW